jgi:putative transposase
VPRISRVVVPGLAHHVTQRGNNRQDVFLTDADRVAYLQVLKHQAVRCRLEVLGYCLMTNHIHLVVVPQNEASLAQAIGRTHFTYAQRFNTDHGRSGHLWQGRFYSCAMESGHELAALRYVEQNPVRAGLVGEAWRYPWSSAAAHTGRADPSGMLDLKSWQRLSNGLDWREFLLERAPDEESSNLRRHTMTGRPLGSDRFLAVTGRQLSRDLQTRPVGRPGRPASK